MNYQHYDLVFKLINRFNAEMQLNQLLIFAFKIANLDTIRFLLANGGDIHTQEG